MLCLLQWPMSEALAEGLNSTWGWFHQWELMVDLDPGALTQSKMDSRQNITGFLTVRSKGLSTLEPYK